MRRTRNFIGVAGLLSLFAACAVSANQIDRGGPGGIPFATGGVGHEERNQLQAEAHNYNLKLVFAATGSTAFVADVAVRIYDEGGKELLQVTSDGPWLFARLPAGKYRVTATTLGSTQEKTVTVGEKLLQQAFYWRAN